MKKIIALLALSSFLAGTASASFLSCSELRKGRDGKLVSMNSANFRVLIDGRGQVSFEVDTHATAGSIYKPEVALKVTSNNGDWTTLEPIERSKKLSSKYLKTSDRLKLKNYLFRDSIDDRTPKVSDEHNGSLLNAEGKELHKFTCYRVS
jgi:hypothetical protein